MTKRFRKFLSILCALALLVACTGTAFADDEQPAETPVEEVTEVVTGEEPGEEPGTDPEEGDNTQGETPAGTPDGTVNETPDEPAAETPDETPAGNPDETPAEGNGQDGSGDDPAELPEGNLPAEGEGEGNGSQKSDPGTTEVYSDAMTLEDALDHANDQEQGEAPAGENPADEGGNPDDTGIPGETEPSGEDIPADVTPPAEQTNEQTGEQTDVQESDEESDGQGTGEITPDENEDADDSGDTQEDDQQAEQESIQQGEQVIEPESDGQDDPVIEPDQEDDPVIEPEQEPEQDENLEDESEGEPEDKPEDETADDSDDEPDENEEEDLVVLKLGTRAQVSSVLTRERPFVLKAVDDYSRIMLFTLTVPEDSVSVTVNDTPITLNKIEDEDPENVNATYTFEYPILQGEDYIITLNAEQDGYIPFDLSMELKPDEKLAEDTPETKEESTDEGEKDEETDSGLEKEEDGNLTETQSVKKSVSFEITYDNGVSVFGEYAHFKAYLVGFEEDEYSITWQYSKDGYSWYDTGYHEESIDLEITEENCSLIWRVKVSTN